MRNRYTANLAPLLISVVIAVGACQAIGAQGLGPDETVRQALSYERSHDNSRDAIFNRRNLNIRRRWITPVLYSLYLAELAREKREAKLDPDEKPYFGDGMSFGPLKETCTAGGRTYTQQFSVIKVAARGDLATVPVSFFYNKACGVDPVAYRFKVVRIHGSWLIDDIEYGPAHTLRKDLRRAK